METGPVEETNPNKRIEKQNGSQSWFKRQGWDADAIDVGSEQGTKKLEPESRSEKPRKIDVIEFDNRRADRLSKEHNVDLQKEVEQNAKRNGSGLWWKAKWEDKSRRDEKSTTRLKNNDKRNEMARNEEQIKKREVWSPGNGVGKHRWAELPWIDEGLNRKKWWDLRIEFHDAQRNCCEKKPAYRVQNMSGNIQYPNLGRNTFEEVRKNENKKSVISSSLLFSVKKARKKKFSCATGADVLMTRRIRSAPVARW